MSLKASVGKAGARLRCPSCQANIVVPEAPKVSKPSGGGETHEVYEVHPDEAAEDDQAYVTVSCPLCHTRMYAAEDQLGSKMTCPDCGTKTIVAEVHEFEAKEEQSEPVEFDGSTEYAVHEGDWEQQTDYREANRKQIPVVCPLCHTRMHAEESQVGSVIVCPDCQTETLVPEVPQCEPEPEMPDVGDYDVGTTPTETFYPKYARMLDRPLDDPDRLPGDEGPRPSPSRTKKPKPRKSPATRPAKAPATAAEQTNKPNGEPSEKKKKRRQGKPPTFGRMFTFLTDAVVWPRWLMFSMGAAVVAFLPLLAVDVAGGPGARVNSAFVVIAIQAVQAVALVLGVLWAGITLPACMSILQETAAGIDAIEEWPDFNAFICLENGLAVGSLAYSALIGYLLGQAPSLFGTPDWLGISAGVFLLFPFILLSLLERGSLVNLFSPKIARSLAVNFWAWFFFYLQSALLFAALVLVSMTSSRFMGSSAAFVVGPWMTGTLFVCFRLMGRLAWHVSGERVPEEPIEPPNLSRLIERGEAEEIC